MTPVSTELRRSLRHGAFDKAGHDHWFEALPCMRQIETGGAVPRRTVMGGPARVLFWNVERLRHIGAITESLRHAAADVMLLCAIDWGMARSANSDRVVEIAAALDAGYAYAVELAGVTMAMVNVHLDSHDDPAARGRYGASSGAGGTGGAGRAGDHGRRFQHFD